MNAGLSIKALKRKYGDGHDGVWRFILHKNLNAEDALDRHFKQLKMDSIQEQKILIEKGYIGYNLIKESQMIQYAMQCS